MQARKTFEDFVWRGALAILIGLALFGSAPARAAAPEPLRVVGLRTEYKENPLGMDGRNPRLSWRLQSSSRGVTQTAYEVRVARSERGVRGGSDLVWSSGRVSSDESTLRAYGGPPLQSGRRYYWQVRVWDGAGRPSAWSEPAWFEMGLLEPSDWKAVWIEPNLTEDVTKPGPVPMVRREFKLSGPVERARAYVTSHGLYELQLNGQRVGETTVDRKRFEADVAKQLHPGTNVIEVVIHNEDYRCGGL